jgi:hypothetical protein
MIQNKRVTVTKGNQIKKYGERFQPSKTTLGRDVSFTPGSLPSKNQGETMSKEKPIFYHQEDCDCIECDARRQPGGLDFDPTNDDAEFEKHEEEIMKQEIKKNQTIRFQYPSVLSGIPLILTGTVLGFGDAVRKMWPEEMGEASDNMLLVWRKDIYGNEEHYAVDSSDVVGD